MPEYIGAGGRSLGFTHHCDFNKNHGANGRFSSGGGGAGGGGSAASGGGGGGGLHVVGNTPQNTSFSSAQAKKFASKGAAEAVAAKFPAGFTGKAIPLQGGHGLSVTNRGGVTMGWMT